MKIHSWNVRGLGGVPKRWSVRECIRKYKPVVIVIHETKEESLSPFLIRISIGCECSEWAAIPAVGTAGGVLLAWNPNDVSKVDEWLGNFSVSIQPVDCALGFEWMFKRVYDPSTPSSRNEFWEELKDIHGGWMGPWVGLQCDQVYL